MEKVEPEVVVTGYPAVLDNPCVQRTPCGQACILQGSARHRYHTCRDASCPHCHDPKRFGRMADDHLAGWHPRSNQAAAHV